MTDSIPPPLPPSALAETPKPKWRWGVHLAILIGYVLSLGVLGYANRGAPESGPAMPHNVRGLLMLCVVEFGIFAGVAALACVFSRPSARDLFMQWRGGMMPILWGIVQSIALRVGVSIIALFIMIPIAMVKGQAAAEKIRPRVESLVDFDALKDPVYAAVTLTLVSFVVAGFREEFWRAAVIAGLAAIAPRLFGTPRGRYGAVVVAAVIFGLGHLPQGWGGVVLTGILGIGLGIIMVARKSLWEAALAHGFFDATTFAALFVVLKYFPSALKSFGIG